MYMWSLKALCCQGTLQKLPQQKNSAHSLSFVLLSMQKGSHHGIPSLCPSLPFPKGENGQKKKSHSAVTSVTALAEFQCLPSISPSWLESVDVTDKPGVALWASIIDPAPCPVIAGQDLSREAVLLPERRHAVSDVGDPRPVVRPDPRCSQTPVVVSFCPFMWVYHYVWLT